ncbi:hypothetical protein OROMI_006615 [Orobanche minor]
MATATTMAVGLKPFPSEPPPTQQKTEYDLSSSADADDDLYSRLKMLQRQHEFIEIHEEYVKDDLKNLRRELLRSHEEVKRIQSVPLHIRGANDDTLDSHSHICSTHNCTKYFTFIGYGDSDVNNAEANERIRFQSLASADLSACLKKKQMNVLFPQIVQIMFIGVLFVFGAISLVVSRVSFNCSATVSFSTSLILLIEPIQR